MKRERERVRWQQLKRFIQPYSHIYTHTHRLNGRFLVCLFFFCALCIKLFIRFLRWAYRHFHAIWSPFHFGAFTGFTVKKPQCCNGYDIIWLTLLNVVFLLLSSPFTSPHFDIISLLPFAIYLVLCQCLCLVWVRLDFLFRINKFSVCLFVWSEGK